MAGPGSDPRAPFDATAHLQEIIEKLRALPPEKLEELHAARRADARKWFPTVGPQREAYHSKADVLLYGGSGGSGKSELGLGLAFTAHERSLILRREYVNLHGLIDRALQINGSREGFNGASPPRLRLPDGRQIVFGANEHEDDVKAWQGVAFDFKYLDEASHFLESQVRFHMAWMRSANTRQRVRMVLGSNAPTSREGEWLIRWFAPWVDPAHPNPAAAGELRWFITSPDGEDIEIDEKDLGTDERGRRPVQRDGVVLYAMSRTFIRASLKDNPYLSATNYRATLDALPEPLRSAVRDGNFAASRQDAEFQILPTSWVEAAFARWKPDGGKDFKMSAMAFDPAGGGKDSAVLGYRHGPWFAPLVSAQGKKTGDALTGLAAIIENRRDGCPVVVDVGGGYASGIKERLKDAGIEVHAFNGAHESKARAKGSNLPYANKRAEAVYKFREALDPNQDGGSEIALPPDPVLKADLLSMTMDPRALEVRGQIQVVAKENIRKQLGRSPDRADAVIMAWSEGAAAMARLERATAQRPAFAKMSEGPLRHRSTKHEREASDVPPWRR